jgi:hypothetical protein
MTEDDAKKKWCPFSRVSVGISGMVVNRHQMPVPDNSNVHPDGVHDQTRCLGRDCMMFRNLYDQPSRYRDAGWYCGLTGNSGYA